MNPLLPKRVFRITREAYARTAAEALSGNGGLHAYGRWHSLGSRVIYTGENTSVCLLERLVHGDEWFTDRRPDRVFLDLAMPSVPYTFYTAAELAQVDPNWRDEGNPTCRALGDQWLAKGKHCAIIVPSAADPMAHNVLLNPAHSSIGAVLSANLKLTITPLELDHRVVSLARQRRGRP